MSIEAAGRVDAEMLSRAGKYLTFAIGDEEYGVEILRVREIIGIFEITAVPCMPHYVRGVMNLRGQVITVIDLRARFDMPTVDATDRTCIVVVETTLNDRSISTGIVVDHVSEVLDIAADQIEAAPTFSKDPRCGFVRSMGKIGSSVKILLNIDAVLAEAQAVTASNVAEELFV